MARKMHTKEEVSKMLLESDSDNDDDESDVDLDDSRSVESSVDLLDDDDESDTEAHDMDISDNLPTACSATALPTGMLSGLRWDDDTMKIPLCEGQKKAMMRCKVCYKKKNTT